MKILNFSIPHYCIMKKLLPIFIFGLTYVVARPTMANAAGINNVVNSLDNQANIITNQPIVIGTQPTSTQPTQQPVTVDDVKGVILKQVGIQAPAKIDVNQVGNGVIDNSAATAKSIAEKQTAGVMSALNKLPFGSILTPILQEKLATGIGNLAKDANGIFAAWMSDPGNPVGGYAEQFNNIVGGIFGNGGGDPNTASKQAEASQKAIDNLLASFGDGATQAAKDIAQFTNPNANTITIGISNTVPSGDLNGTVANMEGRLAVAGALFDANPATGQRDDLALAQAAASKVVAASVVGVAGIATTQSDMAQVGLSGASAEYYGSANRDNSLDKLTDIGKGIAASAKIADQNAKYISKSVTLSGQLLKQNAVESERLTRRAQEEDASIQKKNEGHQGGMAFLAGVSGVMLP